MAVLPAKVQEAQLRLRIGYVSEDGTDPGAGIKELVLPLSVQPASEWTIAGAKLAAGDIEEHDLGTMSIIIEWTDADGNTGTTS